MLERFTDLACEVKIRYSRGIYFKVYWPPRPTGQESWSPVPSLALLVMCIVADKDLCTQWYCAFLTANLETSPFQHPHLWFGCCSTIAHPLRYALSNVISNSLSPSRFKCAV